MANQDESMAYGWSAQQLGPGSGQSGYAQKPGALGMPRASDNYLLGWTGPFELYSSNNQPTAGEVYLQRVIVEATGTISNIFMFTSSAGSSMTAGKNFAGVYTRSGGNLVLQGSTGDISSSWTSAHVPTSGSGPGLNLSAGVPVVAGQWVWVAELWNSSGTLPSVVGGARGTGTSRTWAWASTTG